MVRMISPSGIMSSSDFGLLPMARRSWGSNAREKRSSKACAAVRCYNINISCDLLTGFQQPTSSSANRSCLFLTNFFEALRSCLSFRWLFKASTQALYFIHLRLLFRLNMNCNKEDTYTSVSSVESEGTIPGSGFSSLSWQRTDARLECKKKGNFRINLKNKKINNIWTALTSIHE